MIERLAFLGTSGGHIKVLFYRGDNHSGRSGQVFVYTSAPPYVSWGILLCSFLTPKMSDL